MAKKLCCGILLLFLAALPAAQAAIPGDSLVTVALKHVPLRQILNELGAQTTVRFSFDDDLVDAQDDCTLMTKRKPLTEILHQLLDPTNIDFRIVDTGHIALAKRETSKPGTISGFVVDDSNGEALIGSNVFLQGTTIGSATNRNGYFVLPKVQPGYLTLVCSYLGYEPFKTEVALGQGEQIQLSIRLKPTAIQYDAVTVFGDSASTMERLFDKTISKLDISGRQLARVPQFVETDLLRTIQMLPGVVAVSDFSSAPYVRGGTPDQNLYLLDGTDVYNPEHAFGIFSTFNTDAIKKAEFYKGGFGAEFGGRLSSVLNITNLDGNQEEWQGTATLSVIAARATVQAPIANVGAVSASFRRTYFGQTVGRVIKDVPAYFFYDGNFKAFINLSPRDKLTISAYGGRDFLDLSEESRAAATGFKYDWGNQTGSVRWTRVLTPKLFGNFWLTASTFTSDFDLSQTVGFQEQNDVSDLTLKADLQYHLSKRVALHFGAETKKLHTTYKELFPAPGGRVNIDAKAQHYVSYLKSIFTLAPRWEFQAGVRFNYFDAAQNFTNLGPRFQVKYRLNDRSSIKFASGRYHQYLNKIPRQFIADIWTLANRFQQESHSDHFVAGLQVDLGDGFQAEAEVYHKNSDNIHNLSEVFLAKVMATEYQEGQPVYASTEALFNSGDATSRGVELLIRKETGLITGWLSYSHTLTQYKFENLNSGKPFAPRHDRANTLYVTTNVNLRQLFGERGGHLAAHQSHSQWFLGLNFVYASGQPITRPSSGYLVRATPDSPGSINLFTGQYLDYAVFPGSINNYRLPAYMRLDLSLVHKRRFRSLTISPFLQVFNVGWRKNIWFVRYSSYMDFLTLEEQLDKFYMFPILPSIGVTIDF